ncbi:hypothetical protein A2331_03420 [Candidatus Falkowbacteria bacterium RIFOXYB2_FULL_34_18]|uniref:DUF3137 domain-containing protein n=1 Tax=Candidatus Falkowbacteria bacterium RIFOXYD2_FULL_34_120 TaxID=1798007 RepID=A0A1F5TNK9_9BACT|nr:MAG: hypothetical protein A2331_03420 [Candidatus Falkowbacteria bacterium RIFOXYB2_FULL_34_18]OGF28931.1 MAG: hypothetical protein A2500_01640 [Candidatus Falkowbacteria bacterium RIFOXYC12_FULL_34_55]OGF35870.1 MAG: hypothetical protein A2466_03740 [Candidatus Falkowbacteria bacterium RIFOXYC2_FULL_34_220]OGF38477.1 MAG: hypothetical protein A2515_07110 [Candidatus Falkowbacteria bacterium RIFOXYD12_FULL_34_57]OGF40543.1 MAG: hypothetical protein A2531_04525 [Candidatus Falkowbacteria bact
MSHNKNLDVLLGNLRGLAESAEKEDHFKPVFDKLREFISNSGPIKYNHGGKWMTSGVFFVIGAIYTWLFFTSYELQRQLDWIGFVLLAVFWVVTCIPLFMIAGKNGEISGISNLIFEKDILFDNKLEFVNISDKEKSLYQQFKQAFGEFRGRGDEQRKITRLVRGRHVGKEVQFDYEYYVFHYVEVYYVPVTRKVGNSTITTMERRTRTCYRYGLNTDFDHKKGVAVVSGGGSYKYPHEWTTESQKFNKTFSVYTQDQMVAAKFLPPTVVLAFEEIDSYFSGLNLEVNKDGRMNIGFSNSDVLELERQHSIADPDAFKKEIESFLELPKLNMLLEFIETLHKYNDSNF